MNYRRQQLTHALLMATAIGTAGCSSTLPFSRHPAPNSATPHYAVKTAPPIGATSETESSDDLSVVGYDAPIFDDATLNSPGELAPVYIATMIPDDEFDELPGAFENSGADSAVENTAVASSMTLAEFESLALANNPTIQELFATVQKAAGFRTQVGLRANPVIGYNGNQLADQGTDQHTAFISQTIITAGKLRLNRRILDEAIQAQLLLMEAQEYRVATDVRVRFFGALAAQRRVRLIHDFQSVADKGLELAELRKQALEGSQLDVVQAKVQKNEIDLALQQAEVQYGAAWRELVALVGRPQMEPVALDGELPETESALDWDDIASTIVVSSPEYQAAQTRVRQARANLNRHCVQAIPNLNVQVGAGKDNATGSGLINVQVGIPIPVFNKNQGNIAAARAELMRAAREVERVENSIKARLAVVSGNYDSSLAAVIKYADDILPNAAQGLELAETAYRAGETSFVQVLVARRTYFDSNLQNVASQAALAQARARVDGYVLTGALDPITDGSGNQLLRGLTLSQR